MFFQRHDTKSYYPLFWAFVAFCAVVLPYLFSRINPNSENVFYIVILVATLAGFFVYLKSRIDLFNYNKIFNTFVSNNIELLINSSVEICTAKHGIKNEEFFGEFFEYDEERKELRSSIRSRNLNTRIKEMEIVSTADKKFFRQSFNKGFAEIAFSEAKESVRDISDESKWNQLLMSMNSRFPLIFNVSPVIKDYLSYSDEQFNYIYEFLNIRSVVTCPIVRFKKKLFTKKKAPFIGGILLYTSNLPMREKGNERDLSALPLYRLSILKQVLFIARFPEIFQRIPMELE